MSSGSSHWDFAVTFILGMLLSLASPPEPAPPLERFGIGASLLHYDSLGTVVVKDCYANGPADRAGLLPGDRLVEVNGWPVAGRMFTAVLESLRADVPAPVRLSVDRDTELLEFLIVRARLSDVVAGAGIRYVQTPDSSLGWIAAPLHEREPAAVGGLVRLEGLKSSDCADGQPLAVGGRATFIYFWASWCGWCKSMFPQLASMDTGTTSAKIVLLGVNVDDTCEQFQDAVSTLHPPGTQSWGGGYFVGELVQSVGVHRRGLPTAALLDADGRLTEVVAGSNRIVELFQRVKAGSAP